MKKIINRRTGKELSIPEAITLCTNLKACTGAVWIEHSSVYPYPTPELAMKANLRPICEAYEGYVFAYVGTIHKPLVGYRVYVIGIQKLPSDFEKHYPDYVVIG